jgi:REP element-mobilizing transposase RayT
MRHRSRVAFRHRLPCHVTLKVRVGIPSLRTVTLVREIERSFVVGCEREDFRLAHYSLQGNHVHLIVEADDELALGRGMKALGARLARAVNRVFKHSGPVLADRYHVRALRTPREVRNALTYVLLNSRKHAARAGRAFTRAFTIDPASSGRWFDGWASMRSSPISDARRSSPRARAVSSARSWLLTEGWRRRGLLDPDEVPGT